MAEYVDKEFVIEKLDELIFLASAGVPIKPIRLEGTEKLILMEKADVAPVVHGRWENRGGIITCSQCGHGHMLVMYPNYCDNCGAKMDLE